MPRLHKVFSARERRYFQDEHLLKDFIGYSNLIMDYSQATGLNLTLISIRSKNTCRIGCHFLEKKNRVLF